MNAVANLLLAVALNGWLVGLPVAAALAAALRLAPVSGSALRGGLRLALHPRLRALAGVAAFAAVAGLALSRTLLGVGPQPGSGPGSAAGLGAADGGGSLSIAAGPTTALGLICAWTLVTAVLLVREAVGHRRLAVLRKRLRAAAPELLRAAGWPASAGRHGTSVPLLTGDGGAPMTIGLLRPAVYLSRWCFEELGPAELRAVARHELAHAHWRDPLTDAALRCVRILLWPVLPLLALERLIRRETEGAADAAALAGSSDTATASRLGYARTLLAVARRRAVEPHRELLTPHLARSAVGERIRRVLDPASPSPRRALLGPAAALALLLVSAGAVASLPAAAPVETRGRSPGGTAEPTATPARSSVVEDRRVVIRHVVRLRDGPEGPGA